MRIQYSFNGFCVSYCSALIISRIGIAIAVVVVAIIIVSIIIVSIVVVAISIVAVCVSLLKNIVITGVTVTNGITIAATPKIRRQTGDQHGHKKRYWYKLNFHMIFLFLERH
jgi:hypothetical protein